MGREASHYVKLPYQSILIRKPSTIVRKLDHGRELSLLAESASSGQRQSRGVGNRIPRCLIFCMNSSPIWCHLPTENTGGPRENQLGSTLPQSRMGWALCCGICGERGRGNREADSFYLRQPDTPNADSRGLGKYRSFSSAKPPRPHVRRR